MKLIPLLRALIPLIRARAALQKIANLPVSLQRPDKPEPRARARRIAIAALRNLDKAIAEESTRCR
jgi:hypothetical protein